jgi:hypothetical protein
MYAATGNQSAEDVDARDKDGTTVFDVGRR